MSVRVELEGLCNTRDLGGTKTKDGRSVRHGMLFRSGQLYFATENDVKTLAGFGFSHIFDFRSVTERAEKPDPAVGTAENVHISIMKTLTPGISRESKSDMGAVDMLFGHVVQNPDYGKQYMAKTYMDFMDEFAVNGYRDFLHRVLEAPGAVLWHCTAGKDRAGFATVLILEILGVDRQDILEDYLDTNKYIASDLDKIIARLHKQLPMDEQMENVMRGFFSAKQEYILPLFKAIDEKYGSFDEFLRQALGIDEKTKEAFRRKYLEPEL